VLPKFPPVDNSRGRSSVPRTVLGTEMYTSCMQRATPLALGETYHIYNRGAHKQATFTCEADYIRFLTLLFIANDAMSLEMRPLLNKYRGQSSGMLFQSERPDKSLVDVLAYSLMPNHFHLVLRQKSETGITKFLKKVLTGYSMYFNTKYEHSGILFQGPFKSKHVGNEAYFRYIFSYVHLNPLSLFEPGWEEKGIQDRVKARVFMEGYNYSSYAHYAGFKRPESVLLAEDDLPGFLTEQNDLENLLRFTEDSPRELSTG
jgi:putative transposase